MVKKKKISWLQAKNLQNDETFSSFLFIHLARLFVHALDDDAK